MLMMLGQVAFSLMHKLPARAQDENVSQLTLMMLTSGVGMLEAFAS